MTDHRSLNHRHLTTLDLEIDGEAIEKIGASTPAGSRIIVPVLGGAFKGERLSGTINSRGHDWVVMRPDGSFSIDVRMTLKADDDVLIYLSYRGRFLAGEPDYSLVIVPEFECGHENYQWLNDVVAVGVGERGNGRATYTIYEVM